MQQSIRRCKHRSAVGLLSAVFAVAIFAPAASADFQSVSVTSTGISTATISATFNPLLPPPSLARVYFGRANSSFCLSNGDGPPEGASADVPVGGADPTTVSLSLAYLAASTPYCANVYTYRPSNAGYSSSLVRFTTLAMPFVTRFSKVSGLTPQVISYGTVTCFEVCDVSTVIRAKIKSPPRSKKPAKLGTAAKYVKLQFGPGTLTPEPKLNSRATKWFRYLHRTRRDVHMTITTTIRSPDIAPVVDVYEATIKAIKRKSKKKK